MKRIAWTAAALAAGVGAALLLGAARGEQTLQQGFEGPDPLWTIGAADAAYKETAHRITDEFARGGRRSEYIELNAEAGNYIYYTYDIGKATLDDALDVSLYVKANRPGIQLLCRVVLPQEHDPQNLDQPLTTLIKADEYQITGRWQQLTLKQPMKRLREQLQLMRAGQKRDVIGAGAYIDRLVLNVWSGKGDTQVWIDDLEVSPVDEVERPARPDRHRPHARQAGRQPPARRRPARRQAAHRGRQAVLPAHHPPHRHAAQDALRRRLQRHRAGRNHADRRPRRGRRPGLQGHAVGVAAAGPRRLQRPHGRAAHRQPELRQADVALPR